MAEAGDRPGAMASLGADPETVRPLLAEGAAAFAAGLSVIAPPVGIVVLALLVWLIVAGRGRTEQKYAGLRILR